MLVVEMWAIEPFLVFSCSIWKLAQHHATLGRRDLELAQARQGPGTTFGPARVLVPSAKAS